MAFFGKMVAPRNERNERKKLSPIQMPDFDDSEIIKQFEKTLVGRVLNPKQRHRVKALIAFLPEVWQCQDRVKGIDMGTGKFQFRFELESDINQVLARRPYHFDGWFFALERWIPTSRIDFPSSLPVWIQVHGLPDYRCYEKGVIGIGEKLGDLLAWEVQPPRVQVVLEGGAPLVLHRDLAFKDDTITVHFKYERLDCYCKICYRLTHDKADCPERPRTRHNRGYSRRHGGEADRHHRSNRHNSSLERHHTGREVTRQHHEERTQDATETREADEIPAKMPVRRNLFGETASAAKPHSSGSDNRQGGAQTWARKVTLSNGEEKRLGKRPVDGGEEEIPGGLPEVQEAREKRRRSSTRLDPVEEALSEKEGTDFERAKWNKASVAEARAVNEATLWNELFPPVTATVPAKSQKLKSPVGFPE